MILFRTLINRLIKTKYRNGLIEI